MKKLKGGVFQCLFLRSTGLVVRGGACWPSRGAAPCEHLEEDRRHPQQPGGSAVKAMVVAAGALTSPGPATSPTHPDAVHNGSSFALGGLWVADEVIPGTEDPPAEGVVLIGDTGQAVVGVLSHPAREGPGLGA